MNDKISGSCLCGGVKYEITRNFDRLFFCHCQQCRKITGSAHASNLFVDGDSFKWLKGEELVKQYKTHGRDFTKAFCRECGSGVPYRGSNSKKIIVPAGSLDGEPQFACQSRVFYAEKTRWYQTGPDTMTFDGFPDD